MHEACINLNQYKNVFNTYHFFSLGSIECIRDENPQLLFLLSEENQGH